MCHCCVSRNPGFLYLRNPPHPSEPSAQPASPPEGEASCYIRLKCYEIYYLPEGAIDKPGEMPTKELIYSPQWKERPSLPHLLGTFRGLQDGLP